MIHVAMSHPRLTLIVDTRRKMAPRCLYITLDGAASANSQFFVSDLGPVFKSRLRLNLLLRVRLCLSKANQA